MNEKLDRQLKVFLCHSSDDTEKVRSLYNRLVFNGIDAWLDTEKLLPGQEWRSEISKAVRAADVVIVCLSQSSVSKEGYVQKEIRIALDIADEKPEGAIFIIPARLDDSTPPYRLSQWQWVNLYEENGYERLLASLKVRADKQNISFATTAAEQPQKGSIFDGFVLIPAGKFMMGSNNKVDEKPQHELDLSYDFWLARYPVTNAQFLTFAKQTNYAHDWAGDLTQVSDHPVTNVSWHDAQSYCRWLNQLNRKRLPADYAFRLPSEAEWEKAARGSLDYKYPWGNHWKASEFYLCNSVENRSGGTSQVGMFAPHGDSPYGLSDMAGNVIEWTRTLWGKSFEWPDFKYPYKFDEREQVDWPDHFFRVVRGGSFLDNKDDMSTTRRFRHLPNECKETIGFRIAISSISPALFKSKALRFEDFIAPFLSKKEK